MRSVLVLLALNLFLPSQAYAQLQADLSSPTVRAGALAGTSVLQRPSPGATLANPALSGSASGADIGWRWTGDDATTAWAAFEGAGFVFGLRNQSWSGTSDLGLTVSRSHSVFGFDVGVGLAMVERTFRGDRDRALYLNAGVAREVSEFRLAASVLGLDTGTLTGTNSQSRAYLPASAVLLLQGSANSFEVGPLDVILAGRMHLTEERTSAGGGLEVGYWPVTGRTFRVLVGYGQDPLSGETGPTWGVSFSGDTLTLEFASLNEFGRNTHTLGLRWR
ncbi:MAG: hypothetical protein ACI9W4_002871 [Rhodothermales bacterium]